jgi:hypothetical protein
MADDPMKRGPADRARVNVPEDFEHRYSSETSKLTFYRLTTAVKKAGCVAAELQQKLAH